MILKEILPETHGVEISIEYATTNNFTEQPIYHRAACYLHPEAEKLLCKAVEVAKSFSLKLKIFDAFRPSEAQWVLWNHSPNPDFLSDPRKGSPHFRGAAIDLTLLDIKWSRIRYGNDV